MDKQIEALLDRIVDAGNASGIAAYESRIDKLEREKLRLQDQAANSAAPKGHLTDIIELALEFLSSICNICIKGGFALRKTGLRLAFAAPLSATVKMVIEPLK